MGDIYYKFVVKECPKCRRRLCEEDYNWRIKNVRRATYCRECSQSYIREHYKNNTKYYLDKTKKRNRQVRIRAYKYISSYLKSHPCVDCGEMDIVVLEFDHRDQNSKDEDISRIIRRRLPFERLVKEISKCDVRCANCHRRKTAKESKSWKLQYVHVN